MIPAIENLVEALTRLPTIGRKSAWRLALYLLERPQEELEDLSRRIGDLKRLVRICSQCHNYSEAELCPICSSPGRDSGIVCVVEKPTDVFTIEKAGLFRGVYHVLGGLLSPINGVTADRIRIAELRSRLESGQTRELILGLGGSGDAETTAQYIARVFSPYPVRITRFARGLPAGMEIEYIDQITLSQALSDRTDIKYEAGG